jgi:streptogramin lyase
MNLSRIKPARIAPTVLAAALIAIALLPAGAAAKQTRQGLIEELPTPAHVGMIAAGGTRTAIWFTDARKPGAVGRMSLSGEVRRFPLPAGVTPVDLEVGPEGSPWFTYSRGGVSALGTAEGGIGTVANDKLALFDEPPNPSGPPSELVFSSLSGIWFNHAGPYVAGGYGIGTITKSGEFSEFGAGLQPGAQIADLAPAADGNVWFADGPYRAIGRITATGEITEFAGLPPQGTAALSGPAAVGDNLYFSANASPGLAVERITAAGRLSSFEKGLAPDAVALGPFLGDTESGDAWFRVQRHSGLGTTASVDGPLAIGRITAAGKISEYSRCIRPMPAAAGIRELVKGPDGDVWYANSPAGTPRHFRHLAMASIGRITPAGKITEFRFGLYLKSEPEQLLAAGGLIWFVDGHNGRIGQIKPPTEPANAAQALRLLGGKGTRPRLEVEVPGPGKLELKEVGSRPGLASSTAQASSCGPAEVAVPMRPPLVATLRRHGVVFINSRLTFTPRGGSPLTSKVYIEVGVAGK